ncbi:MAG TPA: hypothetical protein VLM38_10005 [Blastocatellia bacterium]|nr:hypothetical protein [Blastocatellia bacterium]
MKHSERADPEDFRFRFTAAVYYVVMLAAFVFGLYGLVSLFFLASAEVQHSVQIIP